MLLTLPYLGGKSMAGTGVGRWINSLLPEPSGNRGYCEPFCGMAGVFCHRGPSSREWLNDKDQLIYNWWCVVRDQHEELIDLLMFTPYAEEELLRARRELFTETDPVRRALNVSVVLFQSRNRSLGDNVPTWARSGAEVSSRGAQIDDRILPLHKRLKDVHLYNEDAITFIERTVDYPNFVVYCDPPYRTSRRSNSYTDNESRQEEFIDGMTDVLNRHKGKVAISGYENEWDHLGWVRREFVSKSTMPKDDYPERIDVLWMNFQPPNENLDLFNSGDELW